jgi:hypothetical protein
MSFAFKLAVAFVVLALAPAPRVVAQFGGGLPENSVTVTTSLLVTGDTSAFPLDYGSLNALFTTSFVEEAAVKLKESLGEEVNLLRHPAPLFSYVSGGKNSGDSQVGTLTMIFVDHSEELQSRLATEAPKVMVEMLRERLQEHFNRQRDQRTQELQVRRERLLAEADKMAAEGLALQKDLLLDDNFVSTEALRQHYLELEKRRREDRLTLLNIDAERRAVEKQIEAIRQQSEGLDSTSPFLEKLKAASETRQTALVKLRDSAETHSVKVAELEKKVAQLEEIARAEAAKPNDPRAYASHSAWVVAERELRSVLSNRKKALEEAERAAMEGKIEYLRKKEELTQTQYGTQLQSLNAMLSQLAIQTDTATARRDAIDNELKSVADSIRGASLDELRRKSTDRQVQLLEAKLERVQQELIDVELLLEKPHSQEFEIRLWGE